MLNNQHEDVYSWQYGSKEGHPNYIFLRLYSKKKRVGRQVHTLEERYGMVVSCKHGIMSRPMPKWLLNYGFVFPKTHNNYIDVLFKSPHTHSISIIFGVSIEVKKTPFFYWHNSASNIMSAPLSPEHQRNTMLQSSLCQIRHRLFKGLCTHRSLVRYYCKENTWFY